MTDLMKRFSVFFLAVVFLTAVTGCSSVNNNYTLKLNGYDMYADSGTTKTDASYSRGDGFGAFVSQYWPIIILLGAIAFAASQGDDNDDDEGGMTQIDPPSLDLN
jgi:hypothetical protein